MNSFFPLGERFFGTPSPLAGEGLVYSLSPYGRAVFFSPSPLAGEGLLTPSPFLLPLPLGERGEERTLSPWGRGEKRQSLSRQGRGGQRALSPARGEGTRGSPPQGRDSRALSGSWVAPAALRASRRRSGNVPGARAR